MSISLSCARELGGFEMVYVGPEPSSFPRLLIWSAVSPSSMMTSWLAELVCPSPKSGIVSFPNWFIRDTTVSASEPSGMSRTEGPLPGAASRCRSSSRARFRVMDVVEGTVSEVEESM
jgi:hypothetical protein